MSNIFSFVHFQKLWLSPCASSVLQAFWRFLSDFKWTHFFLWTLNKCGPRSNDSYARGEACLFWRPAQKTDFCISCGRFQSNWFLVKTCRLWRGEASTRRLGVMWSRTSERSSETRCNWKKTSSLGLWKFRTRQYQLINFFSRQNTMRVNSQLLPTVH